MDEELGDAQGSGNGTCMLSACAAETRQNVLTGIESARLCQFANGSAHGFVRDANKSVRDLIHTHFRPHCFDEVRESALRCVRVKGEIFIRSENVGKVFGYQPSQRQIRLQK